MAADALAVGDDFESWTGIGSLHLQGDPPGRWCDRQAAASSLVGKVPCYLTPACSAPTRNSRASLFATEISEWSEEMLMPKHGFQRRLSPGAMSTSRGRLRGLGRLGMLAWIAGLALLVLVAPTASVASAEVETVHFSGTLSQPSVNPCTGAPGTMAVTFKGISHTTPNPDEIVHNTTTVT